MLRVFVSILIGFCFLVSTNDGASAQKRTVSLGNEIDFKLRNPFRASYGVSHRSNKINKYKSVVRDNIILNRWDHLKELYVHESSLIKGAAGEIGDPIFCSEVKIGRTTNYVNLLAANPSKSKSSQHALIHDLLLPTFIPDNNRYQAKRLANGRHVAKIFYNDHEDSGGGCKLNEEKRTIKHGCILVDIFLTQKYLEKIGEGATCEWQIAKRKLHIRDCSNKPGDNLNIKLFLNSESDVSVVVTYADGKSEELVLDKPDTRIEELVIVGLGDSYASGEGAPDVPSLPNRTSADKKTASYWTDLRCHRSALGSQMRAAIQIAAENQRKLTTFLGFACGAAGIIEGVIGNHRTAGEEVGIIRGVEKAIKNTASKGTKERLHDLLNFLTRPQLKQLRHALCEYDLKYMGVKSGSQRLSIQKCAGDKPRFVRDKIDFLMLSIGGNDGGFGSVIVDALASKVPSWPQTRRRRKNNTPFEKVFLRNLPDLGSCLDKDGNHPINDLEDKADYPKHYNDFKISPDKARGHIKSNLPPLYRLLKCKLADVLPNVRVKNIIVSQYPNPLFEMAGKYCTGNDGIKEYLPLSKIEAAEAQAIDEKVIDALSGAVKDTADLSDDESNWIVAGKYNLKFKTGGWCLADKKGENLYKEDQPNKYNPFAKTSSLILSPKRAMEIQATESAEFVLQPKFITRRTAVFHPNNFGHAVLADNYAFEIRQILNSQ